MRRDRRDDAQGMHAFVTSRLRKVNASLKVRVHGWQVSLTLVGKKKAW